MRKGFVKARRWIGSGWPLSICLILVALPWCVTWLEHKGGRPAFIALGRPWFVWIPLVATSAISFGLAHAILRNDPDVLPCRAWHLRESVAQGLGFFFVLLGFGFWLSSEGLDPVLASLCSGLVLYVAAEGSSIVKDFMRGNF